MEGDPSKTVGARVLLALARVLEVLLLDLRRPGSVVRPYVDVVLRCLVTLFLGEEGSLAVRVRTCWDPVCCAHRVQSLCSKLQFQQFLRRGQPTSEKQIWGFQEIANLLGGRNDEII